jgi:hypothetical protein
MTALIAAEQQAQASLFDEVKTAQEGLGTRSMWTGVLSLQIPALGLTSEYHLRFGKAKGNAEKVTVDHVSRVTGRPCISKEVARLYRYREGSPEVMDVTTAKDGALGVGPKGIHQDLKPITYDEAKAKVRYDAPDGPWLISAKSEKRFFDAEGVRQGKWEEVPESEVADFQDGGEVSPFEATKRLEVGPEDYVPLARVTEYAVTGVYMFGADPKAKEQSGKVRYLARVLMEKQVALVVGFVFRKGYNFYTSLVTGYEEPKSGKLWLLLMTTEGLRTLDPSWALEDTRPEEAVMAAPTARKPKVVLAK